MAGNVRRRWTPFDSDSKVSRLWMTMQATSGDVGLRLIRTPKSPDFGWDAGNQRQATLDSFDSDSKVSRLWMGRWQPTSGDVGLLRFRTDFQRHDRDYLGERAIIHFPLPGLVTDDPRQRADGGRIAAGVIHDDVACLFDG